MSPDLKKNYKLVLENTREFLVFLFTLPWLVATSFWLLITIITVIISTETTIRLGDVLTSDFSGFFSIGRAWFWVTLIFIACVGIDFRFFKLNRTRSVLSLAVVVLLFCAYIFLVWPELDIFLKLRNVS